MPRLPAHRLLTQFRAALRGWWTQVWALRKVLVWGLMPWLTLVAVPYAFLYPDEGLDRPVCLTLAVLTPLGLLAAAGLGQATLVLGAALAGLVPILVAVPALHGVRTAGPVQGLLLALVLLGLLRAAWNHEAVHVREADLRRLARLPRGAWPLQVVPGSPAFAELAILGVAAAGLAMAWRVGPLAGEQVESARAARVALMLLIWLGIVLIPLRRSLPGLDAAGGLRDRWPVWLGRRLSWVGLLGGLWWLWK